MASIETTTVATPRRASRPTRRLRDVARWLVRSRALGFLFLAVLLGGWQLGVTRGWITSPFIPSISEVVSEARRTIADGTLLTPLGQTVQSMAIGYALAAAVGVALGLLMGTSRTVYALLEPLVEVIRPVPIVAYVPLLVLFLGIDGRMKVASIFLGAVFPVLLNTYGGVVAVAPIMRQTGATFGLTRGQSLREIVLPAAAPAIFVGLRLALAIALIMAVVVDMLSGNSGIGFFIVTSQQSFAIPAMYVGIVTLAITGYALNWGFLLLERRVLRWHYLSVGRSDG